MNEKSKIIFSISAILAAAIIVVECVFLFNEVQIYIPIIAMFIACLIAIGCVYAIQRRKESVFKITFMTLIFGAMGVGLYLMLLKTGALVLLESEDGLTKLINEAGIWGPIVFILIQFLQVTFVPVPSSMTIVAGMVVFDSLPLVLVCSTIGMISGSMFAFFLGRTFGLKLVVWMVGAKSLNKYTKMLKGREKMLLFLMFLLPVFPDDLLCLFAGVLTMSYGSFFLMQIIARPIGIITMCISVDIFALIPLDQWWGLMIWGFLAVAMLVVMVLVWKYSNRIEKYMVRVMSKHFGTNELSSTIDKTIVRHEVQNLISDTIIESTTDDRLGMVSPKQRYKAKRYFINYKD